MREKKQREKEEEEKQKEDEKETKMEGLGLDGFFQGAMMCCLRCPGIPPEPP